MKTTGVQLTMYGSRMGTLSQSYYSVPWPVKNITLLYLYVRKNHQRNAIVLRNIISKYTVPAQQNSGENKTIHTDVYST